MTIIQDLGEYRSNHLWMKREDLLPFSFGGNKARKADLFFRKIDEGDYDCVVTYGSGSSNHCRVVANECFRRGMKCFIICPEEASETTFNSIITGLFGVEVTTVPVSDVHDTIEATLSGLREAGRKPFFIEGGGHGNTGTEAYVRCYEEIAEQEKQLGVSFDYIFHASGTGTTQAGLVCGQLLKGDEKTTVGISIARKLPRGRDVVIDSIRSYLPEGFPEDEIQRNTVFIDDYTSGYGKSDGRVKEAILFALRNYGIPLDETYTGKAFMGMGEYIKKNGISGKNILFLHTGGTPLFFDALVKGGELSTL